MRGLFYGIGHQPNSSLVEGQLELDDKGYVKVCCCMASLFTRACRTLESLPEQQAAPRGLPELPKARGSIIELGRVIRCAIQPVPCSCMFVAGTVLWKLSLGGLPLNGRNALQIRTATTIDKHHHRLYWELAWGVREVLTLCCTCRCMTTFAPMLRECMRLATCLIRSGGRL